MTGAADHHAARAATDAAILTVRRAAVTMFMQLAPEAQRRAIEAATDDPATARQAMRLIDDDAQDAHACRCCTATARRDPKQAQRPPDHETP